MTRPFASDDGSIYQERPGAGANAMSAVLQAILRLQPLNTSSEAVASLAAFYAKLKSHDWYFGWSEDSSVYRAGEIADARLQKLAKDSGPVHQWLWGEYNKHMFSGSSWNTPQHPKPPQPMALSLTETINLRFDMAKAELTLMALRAIKPFAPSSVSKLDPVWPIMQKVLYLGAYAGQAKPPALIASHLKLAGAWEQGQQLVADQSHPTI